MRCLPPFLSDPGADVHIPAFRDCTRQCHHSLSALSSWITTVSRAKTSPLNPTVTGGRKSYLDNWISGTGLSTLCSAGRRAEQHPLLPREWKQSEQRDQRPSIHLPHDASTSRGRGCNSGQVIYLGDEDGDKGTKKCGEKEGEETGKEMTSTGVMLGRSGGI